MNKVRTVWRFRSPHHSRRESETEHYGKVPACPGSDPTFWPSSWRCSPLRIRHHEPSGSRWATPCPLFESCRQSDSSNPTDFRREMDPQLPLARTKFRSAAVLCRTELCYSFGSRGGTGQWTGAHSSQSSAARRQRGRSRRARSRRGLGRSWIE